MREWVQSFACSPSSMRGAKSKKAEASLKNEDIIGTRKARPKRRAM
jgi:hypothetical protein